MNNNILVKGIEVIGVLFAAFGGFLVGIAPPQAADARFAVGISSFLALIILFIISALSKRKYKKWWLISGGILFIVILFAAYYYKTNHDALTFEYPPGSTKVEHIAGTELTQDAKEYKKENPGISNSQLLADFGGLPNKTMVWQEDSISTARTRLIGSYVLLVLAIAAAIFALIEGVLGQAENESEKEAETEVLAGTVKNDEPDQKPDKDTQKKRKQRNNRKLR